MYYVHKLQVKVSNLRQGVRSLNDFVAKLDQIYDELGMFHTKWVDCQNVCGKNIFKWISCITLLLILNLILEWKLFSINVKFHCETIAEVQTEHGQRNEWECFNCATASISCKDIPPEYHKRNKEGTRKNIYYHCQEEGIH